MKECELCSDPARMYCESDQASLCWKCDEKVHCANFLVARHSRSLLCHVCQSPTPWKGSGPKLGHTVSVCESCVSGCNGKPERGGDEEESRGENEEDEDTNDDYEDDEDEDEDGDYSDAGGDEDGDEDGENQVVPWSNTPPPPVASSSSSEEVCSSRSGAGGVSALKRMRKSADLDSDDEIDCSSSQFNHNALSRAVISQALGDDEETSLKSSRPLKERKISEPIHTARVEDHNEAESRSTAIITSLNRFQENIIAGDDVSAMILGIRKLSRDPRAVDLDTMHTSNSPTPNPTV